MTLDVPAQSEPLIRLAALLGIFLVDAFRAPEERGIDRLLTQPFREYAWPPINRRHAAV
jgi:hypothetical protein